MPARKLTCEQVADIRTRVALGESRVNLAEEYSLSPMTVKCICNGTTYRECGGPVGQSYRRWNPKWDFVLGKLSDPDIADMTGCSRITVQKRRWSLGIPPANKPGYYDR